MLVNRNGKKIGELPDGYVDIETDELQFAAVKEDIIGQLTFTPLRGVRVGPGELQLAVTGRPELYELSGRCCRSPSWVSACS
jgi:hypothetical protein